MQVSILELKYDISFDDADDGKCFAGQGTRLIGVYESEEEALAIADKLNPILSQAEKEGTIFPVQKYNKQIKEAFGFVLHDIDDQGYHFKLVVSNHEVKEHEKRAE